MTKNQVENQKIWIDPQIIQIFTLLDMLLKNTIINIVMKKDKMENVTQRSRISGQNKWTFKPENYSN